MVGLGTVITVVIGLIDKWAISPPYRQASM